MCRCLLLFEHVRPFCMNISSVSPHNVTLVSSSSIFYLIFFYNNVIWYPQQREWVWSDIKFLISIRDEGRIDYVVIDTGSTSQETQDSMVSLLNFLESDETHTTEVEVRPKRFQWLTCVLLDVWPTRALSLTHWFPENSGRGLDFLGQVKNGTAVKQ